jgi:hypothetical protein
LTGFTRQREIEDPEDNIQGESGVPESSTSKSREEAAPTRSEQPCQAPGKSMQPPQSQESNGEPRGADQAAQMASVPYIGTGKKSGFRYRCRYDTETGYRHRIPDFFPVYTGTETGKPDLFPVSEILKSVFLKLYFN